MCKFFNKKLKNSCESSKFALSCYLAEEFVVVSTIRLHRLLANATVWISPRSCCCFSKVFGQQFVAVSRDMHTNSGIKEILTSRERNISSRIPSMQTS